MLDIALSALLFQGAAAAAFMFGVALLACIPGKRGALYRAP